MRAVNAKHPMATDHQRLRFDKKGIERPSQNERLVDDQTIVSFISWKNFTGLVSKLITCTIRRHGCGQHSSR
jgi:hypothetical protein